MYYDFELFGGVQHCLGSLFPAFSMWLQCCHLERKKGTFSRIKCVSAVNYLIKLKKTDMYVYFK